MKVSTILDSIDLGSIALPEFQRGYVWKRDQVRGFMDSLYRGHPVGTLLVWVTKSENADVRGDGRLQQGAVKLLLDGQQRVTSLYGIMRGKAPEFFDGDANAFTGLYFNVAEETFEFYASRKMDHNSIWVSVTKILQEGVADTIQRIAADPDLKVNLNPYINRLAALDNIKERDFHIEEVTGEKMTIDVIVDIFNKVNSGGTKLSKGDLALAHICASWPDARNVMQDHLARWRRADFHFRLDWLLRCANAIVTGEARFEMLEDVSTAQFQEGLAEAVDLIDKVLDFLASRLGIDHNRVLGSRYAIPLMVTYLSRRGGNFIDYRERDRLLYWYIHTLLWGRYAGSTETKLDQDLEAIEQLDEGIERLLENLRLTRGKLSVHPDDFSGWSRGTRFYPMLYILTRVWHARDWGSGIELRNHFMSRLGSLQLHHIFPKALLYEYGYDRREVNALANFSFLTQETNLHISDREPAEYFEEIIKKHPGALESHWIPMNRDLWQVENYLDFLAARRALLAKAANRFLEMLRSGGVPESEGIPVRFIQEGELVPGTVASDEEERLLQACNEWVMEKELAEGEFMYQLVDEESGDLKAIIDLAWPDGVQEGLSRPVAILLDEDGELEDIVNRAGYLYFTDVEAFKRYVREDILTLEPTSP